MRIVALRLVILPAENVNHNHKEPVSHWFNAVNHAGQFGSPATSLIQPVAAG